MKIFSAQGTGHKEFSLIEFRSELEALPLINGLTKDVKLIDMFSLLNGHFVLLISCNDLKKTFENLRSHPSALGGYFTNDTNMESLHAFYYLNKVNISDALLIAETEKISKLFEILDQAHKGKIGVLDIKNQRSHKTNTIYFTGTLQNISDFQKTLSKVSDVKAQLIDKVSDSLHAALDH